MVYTFLPKQFTPKFEVVGCFCEFADEILLLRRQAHKPQGNTWGLPAGKLLAGETPLQAVLREVVEETGFLATDSFVRFLHTYYIRYREYDYVFHLFHYALEERRVVTLHDDEHSQYVWAKPDRALEMHLIEDLGKCIEIHYMKKD